MKEFFKLKEKRGITLIALIITIIVLLILAGVSISMIAGDNGILTQAQNAKAQNIASTVEDKVKLEVLGSYDKNVKLDAKTVASNLRSNIGAEVEATVGDEDKFPLRATVEGVDLIVDYDGDVRKPVTNPYDKDGWTYAWVCGEDGNWIDTQFDLENGKDAVEAVEERNGIIAKFYKQNDKITPPNFEETTFIFANAYHLVIEGTGDMGDLIIDNDPKAWLLQFFTNLDSTDPLPLIPYVTDIYICDGINGIGYPCISTALSAKNIWIGNTVTTIGTGAFGGSYSLQNIKIPSSVTKIEGSAFGYCKSLTSIIIPNNVISIGEFAFFGCEALTNITIPSSVTSIGNSLFWECSSLKTINFKGTKEKWNEIVNSNWNEGSSIEKIICTDGEITIE